MSYSYTEKRRIRKNFGRLPKVMELPKLIKTQLDSYAQFLQQHVEVGARENKGLEEVFQTLFPITSVSGNAALEYASYQLGKPGFKV
jgi:DNA-directed RNA polymerase subunit beta